MKRNLFTLMIFIFISFSVRADPGDGDPPLCDDPDLPPDESCYYQEPDIPLDNGTPFLIAVALFWGLYQRKNQ